MTGRSFILTQAATQPSNRVTDGLLALYDFTDISKGVLADMSGTSPALDLQIENPGNIQQGEGFVTVTDEARFYSGGSGSAQKIYDGVTGYGGITVEAWIKPATVTGPGGTGPARIVTMSHPSPTGGDNATNARNFLLGQGEFTPAADDHMRARFRSEATDKDGVFTDGGGQPPLMSPDGSVVPGTLYHMVMTQGVDEESNTLRIWITEENGTFSQQPTSAVLFDGSLTAPGSNHSGWDPTFVLNLFNENDGTNPTPRYWTGEAHLVAIYQDALTPAQIEQNFYAGPEGDQVIPPPSLGWKTAAQTASEVTQQVEVVMELNRIYTEDVSATVSFSGTAEADTNYTIPSELTITIPAGGMEALFTVSLMRDGIEVDPGNIVLTLGNYVNAEQGAPGSEVHTITLEDADIPPVIGFALPESTINRPLAGNVSVVMDRSYFEPITISIVADPGSVAQSPEDYTTIPSLPGVLTFAAGQTQATLGVDTFGDETDVLKDLDLVISNQTFGTIDSGASTHTLHIDEVVPVGFESSITQYGITWSFVEADGTTPKFHQVGQYITGDWWVVGPINLGSISPGFVDVGGGTPGNPQESYGDRNGSMVNPGDDVAQQVGGLPGYGAGYDGRAAYYNRNNNIGSHSFPQAYPADTSIISTISNVADPQHVDTYDYMGNHVTHGFTKFGAVLTVVDAPQSPTLFRPALALFDKRTWDSADIDYSKVPSLPVTGGAPQFIDQGSSQTWMQQYARYYARPWLLHHKHWQGKQTHPTQNQPPYHRELYNCHSDAACLLVSDLPDKYDLIIGFIQCGIDNWAAGFATEGPDSGLAKLPMIFAGIVLDDPVLRTTPHRSARTDSARVYYAVDGTSPFVSSQIPAGEGWTGATVLWRQDTGPAEHEHLHPTEWMTTSATKHPTREAYRGINSHPWAGHYLMAQEMDMKADWDWDQWFDYVVRWMDTEVADDVANLDYLISLFGGPIRTGSGATSSSFCKEMWNAYYVAP